LACDTVGGSGPGAQTERRALSGRWGGCLAALPHQPRLSRLQGCLQCENGANATPRIPQIFPQLAASHLPANRLLFLRMRSAPV